MGPDEYHSAYPGAARPGLDNNAYTNILTVWVLCRALDILTIVSPARARELCESLGLRGDELALWDIVSRRLRVPYLENGVIAQFDGYGDLLELDWAAYRARYGDIHRLDRILESEGDSPNNYKVSKQADVLMLFYLFSADELRELFARLGYPFGCRHDRGNDRLLPSPDERWLDLSRVAHAWVLARSDRAKSWKLFREALLSDVEDIQGGTTREGIHVGAMAGTVDLLQRCYTGLSLRENVLWINPRLPHGIRRLSLLSDIARTPSSSRSRRDRVEIRTAHCAAPPLRVGVFGVVYELKAGDRRTFAPTRTRSASKIRRWRRSPVTERWRLHSAR